MQDKFPTYSTTGYFTGESGFKSAGESPERSSKREKPLFIRLRIVAIHSLKILNVKIVQNDWIWGKQIPLKNCLKPFKNWQPPPASHLVSLWLVSLFRSVFYSVYKISRPSQPFDIFENLFKQIWTTIVLKLVYLPYDRNTIKTFIYYWRKW